VLAHFAVRNFFDHVPFTWAVTICVVLMFITDVRCTIWGHRLYMIVKDVTRFSTLVFCSSNCPSFSPVSWAVSNMDSNTPRNTR
jgi:hypothetical protein